MADWDQLYQEIFDAERSRLEQGFKSFKENNPAFNEEKAIREYAHRISVDKDCLLNKRTVPEGEDLYRYSSPSIHQNRFREKLVEKFSYLKNDYASEPVANFLSYDLPALRREHQQLKEMSPHLY